MMAVATVRARKRIIDLGVWRWPVGILAAVLLVAATGLVAERILSDPHRFPVRVIEVRGEFQHLNRERLEQSVADAIGNGFVSADMADIRRRLEDMAWVERASLRRIWPDRLRITVTEQVPVARWGDAALVNAEGRVFRPQPVFQPADLPRIDAHDAAAGAAVALLAEFEPLLLTAGLRLISATVDSRGNWDLELSDGVRLALGHDRPAIHLRRLLQLYPAFHAQPERVPARIDMRYGHGIAVQWRPVGDQVSAADSGGKVQ